MQDTSPQTQGESFGRYVLLETIGRGGMAEVFRAVAHGVEGFQRVFVVKRILKEKSASPEFIEMFINEARISALLNHPNIVQIYDFGQIDGAYFLSMEFLKGKDLLSVLRKLRQDKKLMPPEVAAYVAREVAKGLAYAHGLTHQGQNLNIVHRDISPSNIMLLRAGGVKLLDFGIAKAESTVIPTTNGGHITQTGMVKGKLSYLSPEQVRNEPLDGRSDIFSLGVVLWECLTGKRLFYDKLDFQTMRNVLDRPVPPPSTQRMDLPPALDFIVVRALERDREQRYPNAKVLFDDLDNFISQQQFAVGRVPQLLDQLFGEETREVENLGAGLTMTGETSVPSFSNVSITGTTGPGLRGQSGLMALDEALSRSSTSVPPVSVSDMPAWASDAPPGRPLEPAARSRKLLWVGATAVVGIAFAAGFALKGWRLLPGGAQAGGATGAAHAPAPSKSSEGKGAAAADQNMVSVRIESDPAGAEVQGPNGTVLGTTPTTALFPKGKAPITLTVTRPGYQPAKHAITPDRDISALVSLRAVQRAARPAAQPPSLSSAAQAMLNAARATEGAPAKSEEAQKPAPATVEPPPATPPTPSPDKTTANTPTPAAPGTAAKPPQEPPATEPSVNDTP